MIEQTSDLLVQATQKLTLDDLCYWLRMTRAAVERKQVREREYLARRARRGWHTADDEAFVVDQLLETHLNVLLDECVQRLQGRAASAETTSPDTHTI